MKPSKAPRTTVSHSCGWSRKVHDGEDADNALRYHLIQVHNDVEATRKGAY